MLPQIRNCAIYTRKSSEEGLEQGFNSLDAQREACSAYILSQKAEGWVGLEDIYDDGGYSGGNMQRPALKTLLEDIKAGKINIVVVYKIDRLTRSLMDFSKLVEIFDQHGVTFVSVTQSFNTTTSMGRLTLNVLLSFAQFEREVTGERIRDKIAASKKKGMWMGGTTPIGYDVKDRQLVINPMEAEKIRFIYEKYLEIGSVPKLKKYLRENNIKTKDRVFENGETRDGCSFVRSALYKVLSNPVYIGKITHKGAVYEGKHMPILPLELWQTVQDRLISQASTERESKKANDINLLRGLLFDVKGTPYGPVFTSKHGRRYRYYVTPNIMRSESRSKDTIDRLPAFEIESKVEKTIRNHLSNGKKSAELFSISEEDQAVIKRIQEKQFCISNRELLQDIVKRVEVERERITIQIDIQKLAQSLSISILAQEKIKSIQTSYINSRNHRDVAIIPPDQQSGSKDPLALPPTELKNLVRGIIWRNDHFKGMTLRQIAIREKFSEAFVGRCIFKSFEFV